jgi:hypothetical protein
MAARKKREREPGPDDMPEGLTADERDAWYDQPAPCWTCKDRQPIHLRIDGQDVWRCRNGHGAVTPRRGFRQGNHRIHTFQRDAHGQPVCACGAHSMWRWRGVKRHQIVLCATCRSSRVFFRAWVSMNDQDQLEPMGDDEGAWCDVCHADVDTVDEWREIECELCGEWITRTPDDLRTRHAEGECPRVEVVRD